MSFGGRDPSGRGVPSTATTLRKSDAQLVGTVSAAPYEKAALAGDATGSRKVVFACRTIPEVPARFDLGDHLCVDFFVREVLGSWALIRDPTHHYLDLSHAQTKSIEKHQLVGKISVGEPVLSHEVNYRGEGSLTAIEVANFVDELVGHLTCSVHGWLRLEENGY